MTFFPINQSANKLKLAKATPVFKNGSRQDKDNYRPISVLPIFSNIFEKAMFKNPLKLCWISKHSLSTLIWLEAKVAQLIKWQVFDQAQLNRYFSRKVKFRSKCSVSIAFPKVYFVCCPSFKTIFSKHFQGIRSSYVSLELSPVGAFPLRSVCVPFINMYKGRVHDVTHGYNLEKKCVPP